MSTAAPINSTEESRGPQFLLSASILFWGYCTDLIWFALPMALIAEARFYLNRRWALQKLDFYRIADLTSIAMLGLIVFLFMNRQEYHFITTLLAWLPILLFPLVTVLAYSTTQRMTLDVLFYSLRRQREPVRQSWDMNYVFMGSCLLASGFDRDNAAYFPITAMIILVALYRLRSNRFARSHFILAMCLVAAASVLTHTGMREAHLGIKAKTEQWIANWISQRTDPMKTRTALGQIGQLKLSDAIEFRIAPASATPDFPPRLVEAVYNSPSGVNWEVFDPRFTTVEHTDDFTWTFAENARRSPQAKIYLEFDREKALIPVPSELTEIHELAAMNVNISTYGTIQGEGLIPAPYYRFRYDTKNQLGDPPTPTDLFIPPNSRELMMRLFPEPGDIANPIAAIREFFLPFRYSLYQDDPAISDDPLGYFLQHSKRGHCEYFASATAIMLRHLGIPSRYVVGYAVREWNSDLNLYTVRKRHGHAWAVAWIGDEWVAVDTTPAVWFELENDASGTLQILWDFLGNNQFRFQLWWNDQKIEDYETELYGLGFLLVIILIWRIATSEQVILPNKDQKTILKLIKPGEESPFFLIEQSLTAMGFGRSSGELMTHWLIRIQRPELLPLLSRHNRWRFDPHGLSMDERKLLATEVLNWQRINELDERNEQSRDIHAHDNT